MFKHGLISQQLRQMILPVCISFSAVLLPVQAAVLDHQNYEQAHTWVTQHPPEVMHGGKHLSFNGLIEALSNTRLVMVGETHDRYDHHLNQLAVLTALHQHNPKIAIGVEWFQAPFQGAVDEYLADKIDENELLRKTGYFDRWRYDYRMLRPIMEFAKAKHIPVIALNAPSELTRKVSQKGLQSLSTNERSQLPEQITPPSKSYRSQLAKVFSEHTHMGGEQKQLDNFLMVQRIWDESMALNAAKYLKAHPDARMVLFSGSGHISHKAGIPQDIAEYIPHLSMSTLMSSDIHDIQAGMADYFLLTRPLMLPASGKLGVWLNTENQNVHIGELSPNSAASKAGLKKGDRIAEIEGAKILSTADLMLTLANYKPGQQVSLKVARKNAPQLLSYSVTLQ